jgi:hypothetical protein
MHQNRLYIAQILITPYYSCRSANQGPTLVVGRTVSSNATVFSDPPGQAAKNCTDEGRKRLKCDMGLNFCS